MTLLSKAMITFYVATQSVKVHCLRLATSLRQEKWKMQCICVYTGGKWIVNNPDWSYNELRWIQLQIEVQRALFVLVCYRKLVSTGIKPSGAWSVPIWSSQTALPGLGTIPAKTKNKTKKIHIKWPGIMVLNIFGLCIKKHAFFLFLVASFFLTVVPIIHKTLSSCNPYTIS